MSKAPVRHNDDQAFVRELAELLEEKGLSEIEIERGDFRVRVARQLAAGPVAAPVYAADRKSVV